VCVCYQSCCCWLVVAVPVVWWFCWFSWSCHTPSSSSSLSIDRCSFGLPLTISCWVFCLLIYCVCICICVCVCVFAVCNAINVIFGCKLNVFISVYQLIFIFIYGRPILWGLTNYQTMIKHGTFNVFTSSLIKYISKTRHTYMWVCLLLVNGSCLQVKHWSITYLIKSQ